MGACCYQLITPLTNKTFEHALVIIKTENI